MEATSTRTKLRESISRERRHAQTQANNTSKLVDQAKKYDVIPGMVVVMDTDHTILDLNEPAAKASGKQKQECLGLKFWDLFDNPGCRAGTCAASEAVKTAKFCEGEALPLVQGKEVPVLVSANPLFDEAGRVIGVVELVFPAAGDVGLAREIGRLVTANGEGQLSARIDESKFQGRHLDRARSINKMLNTIIQPIQEAGTVLERVTKGDLTACVTGNYKGEHAEIQNYINAMTGTLRASMQSIGQNAEALSSAAEELTATSQQMSANAEETSAQANVVSASAEQVDKNLQTVATGTEEMSTSIKEIAKNAHESAKVATAAVRVAEDTTQIVTKLGDSSTEIGQVIKVITSIAQQTNLLALNATIEAARAGEAGKGFAVVANEVKELAKQTAKATEDISRKIEAIQGDTKAAVSAIGQISSVIRQVNDISNTIATAVEEQNATTNEMARNVGEAAKGSGEITKNIAGVAEAAKSTTHGANDSLRASQALAQMSTELRDLVSRFKIEGETQSGDGSSSSKTPTAKPGA
jgi:methyl-accepting chemotaxis protein